MKLMSEMTRIVTDGEFAESQFNIRQQDVGKIIMILRSKMYSNPIRTICQEVMSNARDAHRERGCPNKPIEVKLPDRFDESFYIRDFGPGISPDRMKNVFINYGASTKDQANDETGGFGLGAKSPFSYVDQFSVISVTSENGKLICRQWLAVIDESNIGKMLLIDEHEASADEKQGTTILLAAKNGDYNEFRRWVLHTAKYWNVRPNVIAKAQPVNTEDWGVINVDYKGNGWRILDFTKDRYGYSTTSNRPIALVDGISYNIDSSSLVSSDHLSDKDIQNNNKITSLMAYPIVLDFNVGEVPLTANRESLDYANKITVNSLRNKFIDIFDTLKKELQKEISSANSLWDACLALQNMDNKYKSLLKDDKDTLEWQGKKVRASAFISVSTMDWKIKVTHFVQDNSNKDGLRKEKSQTINIAHNVRLYFDDTNNTHPARGRIMTIFDKYPKTTRVIVVTFTNKDEKERKKEIEEFNKLYHLFDLIHGKMSKVERKKIKRTKRQYSVVKVREFTYHSYRASHCWNNLNIDLDKAPDDKNYYVHLHRYDANDPTTGRRLSVNFIAEIKNLFNVEIYGISKRYEKKLKENKSWISINELILRAEDKIWKEIEEICDDYESIKDAMIHPSKYNFNNTNLNGPLVSVLRSLYENKEFKQAVKDENNQLLNDFNAMVKTLFDCKDENQKLLEKISNCKTFDHKHLVTIDLKIKENKGKKPTKSFVTSYDICNDIQTRWPMFEYFDSYTYRITNKPNFVKDCIAYIKQCG